MSETGTQMPAFAARLLAYPRATHASLREVAALAVIEANPGISIGPLAALTGASKPSASRAADIFVAEGLAHRIAASDDRRLVRLTITPKGRALLRQMRG